jgi:DNA repair protein RecN (Recombination protein N)
VLTELHVENLGVIDTLDLVLGPGLTALTGETGAGKTMLVEAIELLVGGRADATLVRPGASEARVDGRFVVGDEEIVLTRVVPRDGRSRAYVDGRLATVASLSEHGARLVDLHGQHSHQSLLSVAAQRAALDRFGRIDHAPLRAVRARLTEIDAALAALGGDERTRAREIDLLRFQVAEIDGAGLTDPNEDLVLEQREVLLAGARDHREAAGLALLLLDGGDGVVGSDAANGTVDAAGATDRLGAAIAALGHRAAFAQLAERLRGLAVEVADVAADLRHLAGEIDDDPAELERVRHRRQLLRELCRKYGDSLADVMAYGAQTAERLAELEGFEERAARLEADRVAAVASEQREAATVRQARLAVAPALAREVEAHLRELAMRHARIEIEVGPLPPGDDVAFLLGANKGEPALPLAKVASGGELARTMLALRLVLTEAPDSLVFDEVDAGIGGTAADAVGRALAALAACHQVLVVTHLAQVAARATSQIVVTKSVSGGRTSAQAKVVSGQDRVAEVARMLSGRASSEAARRHAAELLGSTKG